MALCRVVGHCARLGAPSLHLLSFSYVRFIDVQLDGLGARRSPPRLRSTRRSAVESGSTDSGGATSSTILTSSSESRRSKRFLASMRAASGGKEGSGAIYFGLLPGVLACSERRQGRKWRRESERAEARKEAARRSPTMAAARGADGSRRARPSARGPRACERASKGKRRGPRRDLLL